MKYKNLKTTGIRIPAIGQGCMGIGGYLTRDSTSDNCQVELLKRGIELGMTFIDTAEIYGHGHSEEVVGQAVRGIRDTVFIATKVSPEHLEYPNIMRSAEKSLARLNTDYIDLYQVHWPNPQIRLEETMRAMERLVQQGKIRYIGLSNFHVNGIREAQAALARNTIATVQLEYNLFDRSVEDDVLPFCEAQDMILLAYSPLNQGRIANGNEGTETLRRIADKYGKTAPQVALNWLTSHRSVVAIPKAASLKHLQENAFSADFELSQEDFDIISKTMNTECITVPTQRIRVVRNGQGNRPVYQTKKDAIANKLGFVPSPVALASTLSETDSIKPVRLVRVTEGSAEYDYDLVEGRIRYWAWVIAHDGNRPIPAYIRECAKLQDAVV